MTALPPIILYKNNYYLRVGGRPARDTLQTDPLQQETTLPAERQVAHGLATLVDQLSMLENELRGHGSPVQFEHRFNTIETTLIDLIGLLEQGGFDPKDELSVRAPALKARLKRMLDELANDFPKQLETMSARVHQLAVELLGLAGFSTERAQPTPTPEPGMR